MQDGIAIPHARTSAAKQPAIAFGIKQQGLNYGSLGGKPSTIFLLIASTKDAPHLAILTSISNVLGSEEARSQVLRSKTRADVLAFFKSS